ncbi:MAG TPA: hypothetical protein VM577_03895 [Anaerovoracaceae bacterium]|nr:hypothetical protein [Anaerovoracaceae bacterium]
MTKIINLTPHTLNIFTSDNQEVTIQPSGIIARRAVTREVTGEVEGITLQKSVYSSLIFENKDKNQVEFLNDPSSIVVVSSLCLNGVDTPDNFYAPGEQLRNSEGKPIGAKGLTK